MSTVYRRTYYEPDRDNEVKEVSLASNVVSLADGTEVSLADGTEVSLADGTEVSLADGTEVSLADGTEVSLADGTEVSLADNRVAISSFYDAGLDPFSKLRVSNIYTIFDSKQLHDKAPLFWDEVTGGGATAATWSEANAATTLAVDANGEYVIRQTKMRFNYQPGKGQLILITGVMSTETNITKRIGYFNSSSTAPYTSNIDGLYFENDGTGMYVVVSKSGTATRIAQANWNTDKMDGTGASGIVLDPTKAQIFVIDFEWLGVGRVRMGFQINGLTYYCHQFVVANVLDSVYMSSPNHSVRYEIRQNGAGSGSLTHICSSVSSEGGFDPQGLAFSLDRGVSAISLSATDTVYPLIGMRLKTTHLNSTTIIERISVVSSTSSDFLWSIFINPTINEASNTLTWNDLTHSSVQYTINSNSTNALTGGIKLASGYVANDSSSTFTTIETLLRLGATIAGVRDTMFLAVQKAEGGTESYLGSINFRDLQ